MKHPPFLLGAALLFWGWQTDFLVISALMAVAIESPGVLKMRWEFSEQDFRRLWSFTTLLFLAALLYSFTANDGPADFRGFFQNPNFYTQRSAGNASAKTIAAWLRWLPMVFFLFVAAQEFSSRQSVPLAAISLILRRRRRRAAQLGLIPPPSRDVNVSWPYFGMCLFAASVHSGESRSFFWGLCGLVAWGLWSLRSKRFGIVVWACALGTAIGLGYVGQGRLGELQRYLENLNPQWLSDLTRRGFDADKSKTALGRIGSVKASGKIVIRLEPKNGSRPPGLLREASYRTFKGVIWQSDIAENDFENVLSETNNTSWELVPGKTNQATVSIASYLQGGRALLPLPEGSGRLENLAAYTLQKSSLGAIIAQGPGLVIFDALYGPGTTLDSVAGTNDLAVPARETPALDQVISELQLNRQNAEQAMRTLSGFFQSKFGYSTWLGFQRPANTNETPVGQFLLRSRRGHCEYFATATTLLLRRAGVPARYAVGYAVHEAAGRKFVVRQRDAHAWCLVWNQATGKWEDFDTTPASWVEAEAKRASSLQFLSDAWSRITFEFSKLRWGQTRLRQYLLWALVPILALLLYQIIFRTWRSRQRKLADKDTAIAWPGLDSEFYQLEKRLTEHGVARRTGEPLSNWLDRAGDALNLSEPRERLKDVLRLHYRYRFDPMGLTESERAKLRCETSECLTRIMEAKERTEGRRA